MKEEFFDIDKAYDAFGTGNYALAKILFEKLEVSGFERAHLYLGWMYDQGLGTDRDSKKAEHHYRCLGNANDPDGKYYLAALFYAQGDIAQAAVLYEEAAELNHVSGAYWAYSLYKGKGEFFGDKIKSDMYLHKAAALGHLYAKRDLACREIMNGTSFSGRLTARARYHLFKLKIFVAMFRNSQDMRVR